MRASCATITLLQLFTTCTARRRCRRRSLIASMCNFACSAFVRCDSNFYLFRLSSFVKLLFLTTTISRRRVGRIGCVDARNHHVVLSRQIGFCEACTECNCVVSFFNFNGCVFAFFVLQRILSFRFAISFAIERRRTVMRLVATCSMSAGSSSKNRFSISTITRKHMVNYLFCVWCKIVLKIAIVRLCFF